MNNRIQVIARIRPFTKAELVRGDENITNTSEENAIHLEPSSSVEGSNAILKSYRLDGVLDRTDNQQKVFERVEPLLESIMEGRLFL